MPKICYRSTACGLWHLSSKAGYEKLTQAGNVVVSRQLDGTFSICKHFEEDGITKKRFVKDITREEAILIIKALLLGIAGEKCKLDVEDQ